MRVRSVLHPRGNEGVPARIALDAQRLVQVHLLPPALADRRQRKLKEPPLERTRRELELKARIRGVGERRVHLHVCLGVGVRCDGFRWQREYQRKQRPFWVDTQKQTRTQP